MLWYESLDEKIRDYLPDLKVVCDEPMSRHTSFRVGGPAKRMAFPSSGKQLVLLMSFAEECGARPLVIGNGTNLLAPDEGLDRLVIDVTEGMTRLEAGEEPNTILAECGVPLARLADFACRMGLEGLEFAHGIPGSLGGAVCMNAGAYGGEMSQVVVRVDAFRRDGSPVSFSRPELAFGYRHSALQQQDVAVYRVVFQLPGGDREELLQEMVELNRRRAEKQPLNYPSAGSTFKRPAGFYAAALIDECGLRGYTLGGAQVSEKHAGFLLNRGGTAADFLALMAHVQQVVWEKKGVRLEPEVRILGEDAPVTRA